VDEKDEKKGSGLNRRDFLRRAAITGAAAAWAAPVIHTIAATPAFAQTNGTPVAQSCFHSNDANPEQSCMDACTQSCQGHQCDGFGGGQVHGPCSVYCHISPGNQCCNPGLCNPANFTCSSGDVTATYHGSLSGC
jgi:hypothetical protein